jgi:hypothetical protein
LHGYGALIDPGTAAQGKELFHMAAMDKVRVFDDDYRRGWKTEVKGGFLEPTNFSIRGKTVCGVYCTRCAGATTLAFVDGL